MYKLLLYITILIISGLSACNTAPYQPQFDIADSLMDNHPDSALIVLSEIKNLVESDKDKAYFNLLWNLAQYKSYNDDSLKEESVQSASNYFISHNDNKNAALSLYLLGSIQLLKGEFGQAAVSLNRGLDYAVEAKEPYYEGLCSKELYQLYNYTKTAPMQIVSAKRAVEAFTHAGKEDWRRAATVYLASAYHNNDKYNEAINTATKAIEDTEAAGEYSLAATAAQIIALATNFTQQYERTISYYAKAFRYDSTILTDNDWFNIQTAIEYANKNRLINSSFNQATINIT